MNYKKTDIPQVLSIQQRYVVQKALNKKYFKDENEDNFPDKMEKLVNLEKEVLEYYQTIITPSSSFWDRLRAFFSASNKAGRGAKAIKDFALLFTPYGKQIETVSEFITERFIKPEQTDKAMNDSKKWYKSATVNSIIVIIVLGASHFFDVQITEAELQTTIEAVGMALASVVALWGRIRADKKISSQ